MRSVCRPCDRPARPREARAHRRPPAHLAARVRRAAALAHVRRRGWTAGRCTWPASRPYAVDPADHDIAARARLAARRRPRSGPGVALQPARHRVSAARRGRTAARRVPRRRAGPARPVRRLGLGLPVRARAGRRGAATRAATAAASGSSSPPPPCSTPPGGPAAHRCWTSLAERDTPLFIHPGPAPPAAAARPPGGPPWSRTSSRCTPPGSPSAPSAGRATRELRVCFAAAGRTGAAARRAAGRPRRRPGPRPGGLRRVLRDVLLRDPCGRRAGPGRRHRCRRQRQRPPLRRPPSSPTSARTPPSTPCAPPTRPACWARRKEPAHDVPHLPGRHRPRGPRRR